MNALEYALGRLDAGMDEESSRDPLPPLEFPHAVGVLPRVSRYSRRPW